jgi:hypothetical protein
VFNYNEARLALPYPSGAHTMVYSVGLQKAARKPARFASMTEFRSPSPLYLKLLAETAQIEWPELQRFFARGVLLKVARDLDLVSVAEAVADDDTAQVAAWLAAGLVERVQPEAALDFADRNPELWAVVVSPWVCVQERG